MSNNRRELHDRVDELAVGSVEMLAPTPGAGRRETKHLEGIYRTRQLQEVLVDGHGRIEILDARIGDISATDTETHCVLGSCTRTHQVRRPLG